VSSEANKLFLKVSSIASRISRQLASAVREIREHILTRAPEARQYRSGCNNWRPVLFHSFRLA
jgi:hypothetical protein